MTGEQDSVGAWAKRYHLAHRAASETLLRPYGLGSTQWAVLYQLVHDGPSRQRDLGRVLNIERATLSTIVTALLRKGLIEQRPDPDDQRQRLLQLSEAGRARWDELPDPIVHLREISFDGADPAELRIAARVLREATERLAELPSPAAVPR